MTLTDRPAQPADADRAADRAAAVTIVPTTPAHAEGLHRCLGEVAREKRYLVQVEAPALERMVEFVRDNVRSNAPQFVALDAGQVVGWVDVLPGWTPVVAHSAILSVGLLSAYRGQGLGQRMLERCLAQAAAQGIRRVMLEVRADNDVAIALYRKLGFDVEATLKMAFCYEGRFYDGLQMVRFLHPAP